MSKKNSIFELETLYKITYDLKKQGRRITFTHGAFDLFHQGHLDLLQKSSEIGDYLIVAVESDRNISTYKGHLRPIIDENARQEIVNELYCIDAVFINTDSTDKEKTYTNLYRNLHAETITFGACFNYVSVVSERAAKVGSKALQLNTRTVGTTEIIHTIIDRYIPDSAMS